MLRTKEFMQHSEYPKLFAQIYFDRPSPQYDWNHAIAVGSNCQQVAGLHKVDYAWTRATCIQHHIHRCPLEVSRINNIACNHMIFMTFIYK